MPVSAKRSALAFTRLAAAAALLTAACTDNEGEVEIDWTLVDRAGAQVFPSGALDDTCDFVGLMPGKGDVPVDYSVNVELHLCEPGCEPGCNDPACILTILDYDCTAARGYSTVATGPYDFDVHLIATPTDGSCACDIQPPCALVPGPRRRTVEPGLVTDLAVYLMVLGFDNVGASQENGRARLDLAPADSAACCVPVPNCVAP